MMNEEEPLVVDLNTADEKTLTRIPGIGRELARRILDARPFASVEDLLHVRGVGKASLERWRAYFRAEPAEDESPVEEVEGGEEFPPETEEVGEAEVPSGEASPTAEEETPQEETVVPVEAEREFAFRREQVVGLIIGSSLLTLVVTLVLSMIVLAVLNGGRLRYASLSQVNDLQVRLEGLEEKAALLTQDMSGLRSRITNLEALSGRVSGVEEQVATLSEVLDEAVAQVGSLNDQVGEMETQIETLQEQGTRFQGFLEGLQELLNNLFPLEGEK